MTDILLKEMFLSYTGVIDFSIKKQLLADLKGKLDECEISVKARKRCIYVLEELLSNAHEYYKKRNLPREQVQVVMEQVSDFLIMLAVSNTLLITDAEPTLKKVEEINNGDEAKLNSWLQQGLTAMVPDGFGSGLGLISIKLKTGVRFETELRPNNDEQCTFNLKTLINLSL
jgi:hypothetical protein